MALLEKVASVIESHNLMSDKDRVVVAVSGGADSLALLHILKRLDHPLLDLIAVYIDHGLRPQETPTEITNIKESCRSLDIPFITRAVDVQHLVAKGGHSPEDAARTLRYNALEKIRQESGAQLIAVGHTADDQVEEFFIRLIRGSGIKGLSGMKLKRDALVRPLLFLKKQQLADFLSDQGINWCLDSSNLDRQFLRNRIRLDLLPLLEEKFNPSLRKNILQCMDVLAEEDQFLDKEMIEAYAQCIEIYDVFTNNEEQLQLSIKNEKFLENHPAIRRRIIEKSCWQVGIRPTYEMICRLIDYIEIGRNGSELHLGDGVRAEKLRHNLLLSRPLPEGLPRGSSPSAPTVNLSIPGPGIYPVPGTHKVLVLRQLSRDAKTDTFSEELLVDPLKLTFPLQLRSFLPGEKFYPYGSPGKKKISRYFNDQKVPSKERSAWPILLCGNKVVALVGLQIDHDFRITPHTNKILSIGWQDSEG
ncbi:MAG: tRNA lysidine(34) synthetase TilS [Desulforhopalus sp.]